MLISLTVVIIHNVYIYQINISYISFPLWTLWNLSETFIATPSKLIVISLTYPDATLTSTLLMLKYVPVLEQESENSDEW